MRGIEIERLVRRGAMSMADSLHFYWPSIGRNDIPERNISAHLAHVLLANDFFVYAEAHTHDSANVHLDLLALHPSKETLIAGEFKRLYSKEKALAMVSDLERLRAWRLSQDRGHSQLRTPHRFGLLAATTWNRAYADWFNTRAKNPPDPTDGALASLWAELQGVDVLWGTIVLLDEAPIEGMPRTTEWLVYVIFPL
jgi:hypothetical protein